MLTFCTRASWSFLFTCLTILAHCFNNEHHKLHQSALFSFSLCPVLESLSTADGFYNYPLDIYGLQYNTADLKSFSCESIDKTVEFPNMTKNVCSNHKICPVHQDFLTQTKNNTKFRSSVPLLCKITDTIQQNVTRLNIIIFGGSVATGVLADGCNIKNDCGIANPVSAKQRNHPCLPCAWPHYLEMWIEKTLKNHSFIQVHNLALSSHNSAQMAERLYDQFNSVDIKQLTQNDVIFIDHSANDNVMKTPIRSARMIKGLETLIRKLYMFSNPHSLPSIILLGTEFQDKNNIPLEIWYTTQYQKIADHYHLIFWNFDDFYASNYLHNANLTYTKYITRMFNGAKSPHPPWHVQLFNADMIAAMFTQEIMECTKLPSTTRAAIIDKYYLNNINQLPVPLFPVNNSDQCEKSNELFHMSFDNYMAHKNSVTTIDKMSGSWQSVPLNAWQLRLDANGRAGGFIHEYKTDNDTSAELVFTLPLPKTNQQNIIVTLTIFRTYENAGVVTLFYCGKEVGWPNVGKLDALWMDHANYRYSLPESHSFLLSAGLCTAATSADKVDSIKERENQNATFSLVHNKLHDPMLTRGNQKFKLYSIIVCITKNDERM